MKYLSRQGIKFLSFWQHVVNTSPFAEILFCIKLLAKGRATDCQGWTHATVFLSIISNDLRTFFNIDVYRARHQRPPFPVLNTTAQSEKISFWNIQSDNFLKKIVESLVGMCNQDDLLIWEIVEKQIHHLRCRVRGKNMLS